MAGDENAGTVIHHGCLIPQMLTTQAAIGRSARIPQHLRWEEVRGDPTCKASALTVGATRMAGCQRNIALPCSESRSHTFGVSVRANGIGVLPSRQWRAGSPRPSVSSPL